MKRQLWLGIAAAVVIAALVVGFILTRGDDAESSSPTVTASQEETPSAPEPDPISTRAPSDRPNVSPEPEDRPRGDRASDPTAPPVPTPLTVRGRVTNENDMPIAEALVIINSPLGGYDEIVAQGQTNFDGHYSIVVPLWPWQAEGSDRVRAVAEAPDRARGMSYDTVSATNPIADIDIRLPPGRSISGRVIWTHTEEPVPNAVMVFFRTQNEGALAYAQTDGEGRFHAEGLAEGTFGVAVSPNGDPYQAGGRFQTGEEDALVRLKPRIGVVSGQVVHGITHEPVPNVELHLGDDISGLDSWITQADEEGDFVFEGVPLETWFIQGPDLSGVYQPVSLTEDRTHTSVTIYLPQELSVSGVVTDLLTQEPIPGFNLSVSGLSGRGDALDPAARGITNDDGRFVIHGVQAAYWEANEPNYNYARESGIALQVEALDLPWVFDNGGRTMQLTLFDTDEADDIHVNVAEGNPLTVTALDPNGRPISNVNVSLGTSSANPYSVGETDERGQLTVVRHANATECQLLGYSRDWPVVISPLIHEDETTAVMEALPTTSLDVIVVDDNDEPVANAYILTSVNMENLLWGNQRNLFRSRSGEVGRDGRETLTTLPRTQIQVRAILSDRSGNYAMPEVSENVDLEPDDHPTEVTLRVPTAEDVEVRGLVMSGSDEQPIAGATVLPLQATQGESEAVTTGPDGRFEITVSRNLLQLGLGGRADGYARGYWRPGREGWSEGDEVVIRLNPGYQIVGRVVNMDGTPAGRAGLILFHPSTQEDGWRPGRMDHGQSDWDSETGEFAWTLPFSDQTAWPMPCWLMVLSGTTQLATANLMINPEQQTLYNVGTLPLAPALTLTGQVVDPNGEPIFGAQAQWELTEQNVSVSQTHWGANSNQSGRFRLEPLPPGTWRIHLSANEYQSEAFTVTMDADLGETFTLRPREGVEVTFQIIGHDGLPLVGATSILLSSEGDDSSAVASNAMGDAVHPVVPAGQWRHSVSFQTTQHVNFSQAINVGEVSLSQTVDLTSWHTVTGLIVRGDVPEPEMWFNMIMGPNEETGILYFNSAVPTDLSGQFSVIVPSGDLIVNTQGWNGRFEITQDMSIVVDLDSSSEEIASGGWTPTGQSTYF